VPSEAAKPAKPLPRILNYPGALCAQVRRLAIDAGEAILTHYRPEGYDEAMVKADGSPVTLADRESEELIEKGLAEITPGIPMIGEEATEAGRKPDLTGHDYYWLVDPLDGTKEFIKGSGDFTVNIALMHNHQPILGVVYAPYLGELYAAHGPGTAVRWSEDNPRDKSMRVRTPPREGLTVVASLSHGSPKMDKFLESYKVAKVIKRGSSLKFCAVAAAKADIYPRLGPTYEWDTAASDAILRAAGGRVLDLEGNVLRYGKTESNLLNSGFIAIGSELIELPSSEDETAS
jgi:3'(2'), 5'-bisphosphate nucleotidase